MWGCDDGTDVDLEVTPKELEFLARLTGLINKNAQASCQVTAHFEELKDGPTNNAA